MNALKERGAAAVEFALIAPLLVVLFLGIVEFGRAYHVQTMLSQAAREGVRAMALRNDPVGAVVAARAAAPTLVLSTVTVNPSSCLTTGTAPAPNATVTVTYSMSLLSGLFGAGRTLTATGVMKCNG
jgi:Flp pilus assembly protein TadG